MGLINFIRDLINEHGSAAIQTKHIALLKEQLAICTQKTLVLENENGKLKTTNQALETENENLKQEIKKRDEAKKIKPASVSQDAPPRPPRKNWVQGWRNY